MSSLAVIGSPCMDVIVDGFDVQPALGTNRRYRAFDQQFGGCALNAAIIAGRLGLETHWYTWLPQTPLGVACKSYAEQSNIVIHEVGQIEEMQPIVILIDKKTKQRSFLSFDETGDGRRRSEAQTASVDLLYKELENLLNHDVVFIAGLGPDERYTAAITQIALAIKLGRKSRPLKTQIAIDVVAVDGLDKLGWNSRLNGILKCTDWFFPNDDELRQITGIKDTDDTSTGISSLIEGFPNINLVGVKMGLDGCVVKNNGAFANDAAEFRLEARQRTGDMLRDQTGAGDAWSGALISSLLSGKNLGESARRANFVASICVEQLGATRFLTKDMLTEQKLAEANLLKAGERNYRKDARHTGDDKDIIPFADNP